jgi:hypothetical protein
MSNANIARAILADAQKEKLLSAKIIAALQACDEKNAKLSGRQGGQSAYMAILGEDMYAGNMPLGRAYDADMFNPSGINNGLFDSHVYHSAPYAGHAKKGKKKRGTKGKNKKVSKGKSRSRFGTHTMKRSKSKSKKSKKKSKKSAPKPLSAGQRKWQATISRVRAQGTPYNQVFEVAARLHKR